MTGDTADSADMVRCINGPHLHKRTVTEWTEVDA